MSILAEKIHDNRFLRLIGNMLTAGYVDDWEYHETLSGTPQGGVVSPILSCIYLHKLDEHVEKELIPRYTRGSRRRPNPKYREAMAGLKRAMRRGDRDTARELRRQMQTIPAVDPTDPDYRRLRYLRYADDHVLGFNGPKAEAEEIKADLARFLKQTLKLELNQEKTLITHARTQPARFLGYDITVQHNDTRLSDGRRKTNGRVALRVPPDVIKAKCAPYRQHGKPWRRAPMQNLDDYDIVRIYGAEYQGVVNYYLLAQNVGWLATLQWNAETSMLKTLAGKHHSTVAKMAAQHKAKIETSHGTRTCFEAKRRREGKKDLIARFGGISLRQAKNAVITDPPPVPIRRQPARELIQRLRARWCEMCERPATVEVHQIAKLAGLGTPKPGQPRWATVMARMRRKTLVVCNPCHQRIHATPVTHAA